jgi:hypothetical protein
MADTDIYALWDGSAVGMCRIARASVTAGRGIYAGVGAGAIPAWEYGRINMAEAHLNGLFADDVLPCRKGFVIQCR